MRASILDLDPNQIEKDAFAVHMRVGRFKTAWHSHPKHQLLYAEDGVVHLLTDHQQFLLPARHAAWIPAQCTHKIYSNSPELYWRNLYFKVEENEDPVLKQLRVFTISSLAREMILYTEGWNPADEPDGVEQSFYQTLRLLAAVWINNSLPLILPSTESPPLKKVTAHIRENLAEPLQMDSIAKMSGYSSRTLMRLFKKELGMTFGTYLRVARVIWALELLTQPNASVTAVAYAVGYQSPSSFSHTFRQLVGVWPQEYLRDCC